MTPDATQSPPQTKRWYIVLDPEGKNPGAEPKGGKSVKDKITGATGIQTQNTGGMKVVLMREGEYGGREVARVAWVRKNVDGATKRTAFKTQLRKVVEIANDAVEIMNEQQRVIDEMLDAVGNGKLV